MAANTFFPTKTILASFPTKTILASLLAIGIASLLAIGTAGGAQAQAPSTLDSAGYLPSGHVAGNIVGGGNGATISGGGDDMVIQYSQPGAGGGAAGWGTTGLVGRFASTDGDGPRVAYGAPTTPARAGREAWLTGGGDDAQVVYASPHNRR
jgi:hypothetical protein